MKKVCVRRITLSQCELWVMTSSQALFGIAWVALWWTRFSSSSFFKIHYFNIIMFLMFLRAVHTVYMSQYVYMYWYFPKTNTHHIILIVMSDDVTPVPFEVTNYVALGFTDSLTHWFLRVQLCQQRVFYWSAVCLSPSAGEAEDRRQHW